ncbi:unnamed protein product [Fraxinus pennsylvanica]|uniref:Uncharacterized protein n=1 Tax=Fraxinus pennsylvanica TaxID=56036 RepID=A0AAD2AGN1_9LAMI|nr:unnamed protein product [Fraxinus pennsylvanica]
MCTSPPSKSTQAPSFNVLIGHVAGGAAAGGGGGQGVPFPLGGLSTGGTVTGGVTIGGRVTGGLTIGGRITGGLTIGGRVTGGLFIGGRITGGLTFGGRVPGGLTLGGFLGFLCFGGGLEQYPQPRMGVAEEIKSMEIKRKAVILEDSMI